MSHHAHVSMWHDGWSRRAGGQRKEHGWTGLIVSLATKSGASRGVQTHAKHLQQQSPGGTGSSSESHGMLVPGLHGTQCQPGSMVTRSVQVQVRTSGNTGSNTNHDKIKGTKQHGKTAAAQGSASVGMASQHDSAAQLASSRQCISSAQAAAPSHAPSRCLRQHAPTAGNTQQATMAVTCPNQDPNNPDPSQHIKLAASPAQAQQRAGQPLTSRSSALNRHPSNAESHETQCALVQANTPHNARLLAILAAITTGVITALITAPPLIHAILRCWYRHWPA